MNATMRLLSCVLAILIFPCVVLAQDPAPIVPSQVDDFATLLITTKSPQERATLLASKKDLLTPDLRKSLIRKGNVHLMAGHYGPAFEIYDLAHSIATQIGDKEGMATACLDIGTVYYFQANYTAALEQYRKARQLFLEVKNDYEAAKALSGLALIYKEQRRDSEALEALQQTLLEFTELSDKEEMSNALSSIGSIYYGQAKYDAAAEAFRKSADLSANGENVLRIADSLYMQGDYGLASRYYKQSLEAVTNQNHAAGMIAALNGAANSAYYQGNYDEALAYYQQNLSIEASQRDQVGVANSYRGMGNVYRSRGDYAAALENYFKSLQISEELRTTTGTLLGSIGLVRALQNNNSAALEYYEKALKQFDTDGNKIDTARVLSLIGNAYYAQGNLDLALDSYRKGLSLREAMEDKAGQADVQIALGTVFLKKLDFPQALLSYETALELIEPTGNKSLTAAALTRIADVRLLQTDYVETLNLASRAMVLAKEAGSDDVLWYAKVLMGKAQWGMDKPALAHDLFVTAVSTIESTRSELNLSEVNTDRNSMLPYFSAIDLAIEQGNAPEAFEYAERAKIQSLYEVFRRNNTKSVKGLSEKEKTEERNLVGEAVSLQLQLERDAQSRTSTPERRSTLTDRLRLTRATYADFRNKLFLTHPRLKVERGELAPLKVAELPSLISDRQTAVLEFVTTERDTYLFVITLDPSEKTPAKRRNAAPALSIRAVPLNIRYDELRSQVKQVERLLSERNARLDEVLRQLYDRLMKPAVEQLSSRTRLIVVPDGVLWRVPLEALKPSPDGFVIDQMEVSYAPSLTALREFRKHRRIAMAPSVLVAGSPVLAQQLTERIKLAYNGLDLETSADRGSEINEILSIYPAPQRKVLSGTLATENGLKRELLRAGIVHIAAPALNDDMSPVASFIGLSAEPPNDGFLETREVMKLQTSAKVVIQSNASNIGDYFTAPLALSWSWFVAGAPTVVLNRWLVQSTAGTKMMKDLHTQLRTKRSSSAAALRTSALTLRNSTEYRHPFYWSTFALIGDAR